MGISSQPPARARVRGAGAGSVRAGGTARRSCKRKVMNSKSCGDRALVVSASAQSQLLINSC